MKNPNEIPDWLEEFSEEPSTEEIRQDSTEVATPRGFTWQETPGVTGRVAAWILSQAKFPQPELSVAAALALVSVLKAHKVRTETDLRTNILLANIAPSGAGKNWPLEAIRKLCEALNVSQGMLLGEPASDSGLLSNLRLCQDKGLLIWDEFGDALAQLTGSAASGFQKEILAVTKKLFSSASSVYTGKSYSDGSQRQQLILRQPCLSVLGASTPERLYGTLSSSLVEDGFLSRFLFIEIDGDVEEVDVYRSAPPPELLFELNKLLRLPTNAESEPGATVFEQLEVKPRVVPLSRRAKILAKCYSEYFRAHIRECGEKAELKRAIWARGMEHTLKIALVVSDGPEITVRELAWAFDFVADCITQLISKFSERVADSERERKALKVLAALKGGELTKNQLTRKLQSFSNAEREDLLASLEESGQIYKRIIMTDGSKKPAIVYGKGD